LRVVLTARNAGWVEAGNVHLEGVQISVVETPTDDVAVVV
jgi:hypothetical protein